MTHELNINNKLTMCTYYTEMYSSVLAKIVQWWLTYTLNIDKLIIINVIKKKSKNRKQKND